MHTRSFARVSDASVPIELGTSASRIGTADLALGLRLLATLLDSGLPLRRALPAFEELAPTSWRPLFPGLRAAMREGRGIAAGLGAVERSVPTEILGVIRAGEAGGGLARAMMHAAELSESRHATALALRAALAYPALLAVSGAAALTFLVLVVLPGFATTLVDVGRELPPLTSAVLDAAALARQGAVPFLGLVGLTWVAARRWHRQRDSAARWHAWLLALPAIGSVRRSRTTAEACSTLAALLHNGVPLGAALRQTAGACGDAAIAGRLDQCLLAVVTGEPLSAAATTHQALTSTAIRLIQVGEQTGRLADMLSRAGVYERAASEQLVASLVRLVEPALIVSFGAGVALIATALLQAVYSVRPL